MPKKLHEIIKAMMQVVESAITQQCTFKRKSERFYYREQPAETAILSLNNVVEQNELTNM